MAVRSLFLKVITPSQVLYEGEVSLVRLPGSVFPFVVLPGHAPIISSLSAGTLSYSARGDVFELPVKEGFVQVLFNEVTVCIEQ